MLLGAYVCNSLLNLASSSSSRSLFFSASRVHSNFAGRLSSLCNCSSVICQPLSRLLTCACNCASTVSKCSLSFWILSASSIADVQIPRPNLFGGMPSSLPHPPGCSSAGRVASSSFHLLGGIFGEIGPAKSISQFLPLFTFILFNEPVFSCTRFP